MSQVPGVTDVQVGSYIFMDAQYLEIGGENGDVFTDFAPSLTVMTTVLNTYFPGKPHHRCRRQGADAQHSRPPM